MSLFRREPENAPAAPPSARSAPGAGDRGASRIAPGTRVDGKVSGTTELVVEGEVAGEVRVESTVVIAPSGRVVGLVEARSVHVAGSVEGDLIGGERVELAPTARVVGDVAAPKVAISEGAFLKGSIEMRGAAEVPGPAPRRPD